jgi:hypothetical protein
MMDESDAPISAYMKRKLLKTSAEAESSELTDDKRRKTYELASKKVSLL